MGTHADWILLGFIVCAVVIRSVANDRLLKFLGSPHSFDEFRCQELAFSGSPYAGTCAHPSNRSDAILKAGMRGTVPNSTAYEIVWCCNQGGSWPCIQWNHEVMPLYYLLTTMLYLALCYRLPSDLFLGPVIFAVGFYVAVYICV